ncbi:hypothetical protein NHX12_024691 [Muraenolepis orangiensis]|uniref:Uncharacterized protein n=1 Tax=Muraenolepis orangiensis TaxID=630683 RepID=A0A9Q0ELH0_9TELE|nr:hypothetical protein NHX12_024691 [Muraenolepis orangiensis]
MESLTLWRRDVILAPRATRSEIAEGSEVVSDQSVYGCRNGHHGWLPPGRYSKRSRSGSGGVGMNVRPRSRTSRSNGERRKEERLVTLDSGGDEDDAAPALLVGMPPAAMGLERLTRRHAVKLSPGLNCTVEECSLAVGAVVGHDSVKSASRMNNAVVIFLDCVDKVNVIVEQGVVVQDTFTPVFPLVRIQLQSSDHFPDSCFEMIDLTSAVSNDIPQAEPVVCHELFEDVPEGDEADTVEWDPDDDLGGADGDETVVIVQINNEDVAQSTALDGLQLPLSSVIGLPTTPVPSTHEEAAHTAQVRRITAQVRRITAQVRRITAQVRRITAQVRRITAQQDSGGNILPQFAFKSIGESSKAEARFQIG